MKKLSAYTVASNCTDLTDIRDGIAEIHEAMKTCVESGKHIPSFYPTLFIVDSFQVIKTDMGTI